MPNDYQRASASSGAPLTARTVSARPGAVSNLGNTKARPTKDGRYYRKSGRSNNAMGAFRRVTRGR